MEHLGSCDGMDVLGAPVSLDEPGVSRHMGQYPKLDLGIVGVQEYEPVPGYKHLPDGPPQFHADGDILEVGLRAGNASGGRNSLVKAAVDPSVWSDEVSQALGVGGIELCIRPVVQDLLYHWIIGSQLLQYVSSRGVACLCLFSAL